MLAAGSGWRVSSFELSTDGVPGADSRFNGGGAVRGDASGEASESEEELPDPVSRFFPGDGVAVAALFGEAVTVLVRRLCGASRVPCPRSVVHRGYRAQDL